MKYKVSIYKQEEKNYLFYNDTDIYYKNLEHTYELINNGLEQEFIRFAYLTLCASTLEASLNQIIFTYFINQFGPIDYKIYTDSLINISFKNKLHTLPVIVTKSEYYFNENSSTIKSLEELIGLRNKILHKKPILQKTEYDFDNLSLGMEMKIKDQNYIRRVSKNKCENFNKAILNFKNEFMDPILNQVAFKESNFIKKR